MNRLESLALALLLGGCAVGPDFRRPAAPSVTRYVDEGAPTEVRATGGDIDPAWWRSFGSPEIDALVGDALAHNASLGAARASLDRSRELLRAGYGVFAPQVDAKAGVSRQRYNPAPGVVRGTTFDLVSASASVSYVLDVWGGERRQVEALRAQVDEQRYALAAAWVMLAGNVVNTEIARAAYDAEIEATQASLAVEREQLRITQAQVAGGTVSPANMLSIESQIAATEATLPALAQKVDAATHLLALLDGVTPAEWHRAPVRLDGLHVPGGIPLALPSELVRQRPDILEAEAAAHAANASIGIATAAMLPNVTLGAGYGANSRTPADFGSPESIVWNLAAGVVQPVFHGGALSAQRRAAIDQRNAVVAQYRQTVLGAFAEVADTLRALAHDDEALAAETRAVESAEGALRLVQANYGAGLASYLQVLVADGQYLTTKIGYVEATAQRLQDTVALHVALGGGWQRAAVEGR